MKKEKLKKLEKLINSQLTSKINKTELKLDELSIFTGEDELIDVLQFLKSNENCKFKQLIDIVGVDYPQEEKRFKLVYLLLSHEYNTRIKIIIQFEEDKKI